MQIPLRLHLEQDPKGRMKEFESVFGSEIIMVVVLFFFQ